MPSVEDNVKRLFERIEAIRNKLGIVYQIRVVAISKTFPPEAIVRAIMAGIKEIGENRVQEAEKKFISLNDIFIQNNITRHLVGHLQTNKVKKAVEIFDVIQSVDRENLVVELYKQLVKMDKTVEVLVEVNTSGEETKFGLIPDKSYISDFVGNMVEKYGDRIKVKGFMTVGPLTSDTKRIRESFRMLRDIRDYVERDIGVELPILSMGMSEDFEIAIEEGANMVRIGRAIFGERKT